MNSIAAQRYLFSLLFLLWGGAMVGQNLLINSSFERLPEVKDRLKVKLEPCAFSGNPELFENAVDVWHTYNKVTPDIFLYDSTAQCPLDIPRPRTGNRLLGLIMYHPGTDGEHEYDYHEYVEGRLARTLTPGKRYRVSFWVQEGKKAGADHLSRRSALKTKIEPVNCGNFGFYFSTEPSSNTEDIRMSIFTYDLKPQVVFKEIVKTTDGWTKMSATFVPDRPFRYLIFGNFASDGVTPTDLPTERNAEIEAHNVKIDRHEQKIKRVAYYFFDDFAVVEDTEPPAKVEKPVNPAAQKLLVDKKLSFSATLLFEVDRAELKTEASKELNMLVAALKQNPSIRLEIGGHTDNTGSASHNQQLSEQRADAVRNYLASKGVAMDRLLIKGYGATVPVSDNQTEEGRAANRRVDCKVLE